ncbi:MAG TPA: DUF1259 domain-containing protein [Terrimicrobiaceae bacterium]
MAIVKTFRSFVAVFTLLATLFQVANSAETASLDTAQIEQLTGLKGSLNKEEGVFKVAVPRSDVSISVDGWRMPPFMGLTSWAAFTEGKKAEAMVMGDLVLMQDEVNPVMSAALEAGLSVTALHNHFFYDEPKVYFMHIGGEGTTEKLAAGVKAAFDRVKEIRAAAPELPKSFGKPFALEKNAITGADVEAVLGSKGQAKDGMFKVTIGRKAFMPCACEVSKEMGVNTWAAFAGTDQDALVDGDFVVLESELQPVLNSLRKDGINIVAIHNHMTAEEPRYFFLHYWGRGRVAELTKAVKNALDRTAQ